MIFLSNWNLQIELLEKNKSTIRHFGKYNLVEKRAVCDRKSKCVQTHSQHHVIRCIITVAPAAAVEEPCHSLPAEHHAAAMDATDTKTHTRSAVCNDEYKKHLLHITDNVGLFYCDRQGKKNNRKSS